MFPEAFIRGLRDGFCAAITAFSPPPVRTKIDRYVVEPSYRPQSEDWMNIKGDFDKAIAHVKEEIRANKNESAVAMREGWNGS